MNGLVITPLGTVSPYAKGRCNCPGFLAEYRGRHLLLDCGNGITGALGFPRVLRDLSVIVTHYHKDHFGDLGALQYASFVYHNLGMLDEKIRIYLPEQDFAFNKQAITANTECYADYHDINSNTSFLFGDLKVTFEDNRSHTVDSYMVKLQNENLKVVYTSDVGTTRFDALAEFCAGADLIICESSFLRKHRSASTTHLTAYAAAMLAKQANAKQLLLTHFWPEEDKALYLDEAKQCFENTSVAEEGKALHL